MYRVVSRGKQDQKKKKRKPIDEFECAVRINLCFLAVSNEISANIIMGLLGGKSHYYSIYK